MLLASQRQSLLATGLCLHPLGPGAWLREQQLSLQAIRLREQVTPAGGLEHRHRLGQQTQPLRHLPDLPQRLGQHHTKVHPRHRLPDGRHSRHALVHAVSPEQACLIEARSQPLKGEPSCK